MNGSLYRVLVVDDEPPIRSLIMRALENLHIACTPACDGDEADQLLQMAHFDAVVTDLRMPNRHGHALATDLLSRPQRPLVVVVTGILEPRLAKDLLQRGVDDIQFKPINYSLLATKLRALMDRRSSDGPLPKLSDRTRPANSTNAREQGTGHDASSTMIDREDFQSRLAHVATILPVSKVAIEVVNLTNKDEIDADKLTACLVRDASLAVEILKMANSAFYRRPHSPPIEDLRDAVVRIGFKRVGELALASSTLSTLTSSVLPWVDVSLFWRRSMAAGLVIERISSQTTLGGEDEGLFLSALVRPLGRIVLGTIYPREYETMILHCQTTRQALALQERAVFPESDCQAMADLLATWSIPEDVFLPLRYADLRFDELNSIAEPLRSKVEMLKFAAVLGELAVGRWEGWDLIDLPTIDAFRYLGHDALAQVIDEVRRDLQELESLCKLPHFKPRTNEDAVGVPGRAFAYCNLGLATNDVVPHYLDSLGWHYVPIERVQLAEEQRPVLVNCCRGISERSEEALARLAGSVPRVLIADEHTNQSLLAGAEALFMPASYAALRHCGKLLYDRSGDPSVRRLAAAVATSFY
ncbi:MAG: HDOD domain-containing protein [Pirellulales bacterium]|nr:HDOD domain-containing protein [Pirellulales bacterium]